MEGGGLFGGRGGAVGMCSGLILDSLCPPGGGFKLYGGNLFNINSREPYTIGVHFFLHKKLC